MNFNTVYGYKFRNVLDFIGGDYLRRELSFINVIRLSDTEGAVVAADGFIMGAVPVSLHPEDVTGEVSGYQLKRLLSIFPPSYQEDIRLHPDYITIGLYTAKRIKPEKFYPPYQRIIPEPDAEESSDAFSFDPKLLRRATNISVKHSVKLHYYGATRPALIEFTDRWERRKLHGWKLPFAIIMPVRGML